MAQLGGAGRTRFDAGARPCDGEKEGLVVLLRGMAARQREACSPPRA